MIQYVDLVNGNNSNDGTTFANRKLTLAGAHAALGSAGKNPPDGHEIRIMSTTSVTQVGTATWYGNKKRSRQTRYSNMTLTTGTNPTFYTGGFSHNFEEGDWVYFPSGNSKDQDFAGRFIQIANVSDYYFDLIGVTNNQASINTSGAINGVSRNIIKLDTAVTKDIATSVASYYSASTYIPESWQVSTGVTLSWAQAYSRSSNYGLQLTFSTSFTGGKAAYLTFDSARDYSAYQQISFSIYRNSGGTNGVYKICLCSDTTGDTVVNEIEVPFSNRQFSSFTVDTGSALGSSIQSVAVYYANGTGQSAVLRFSNIIACKAPSEPDSLSLTSMIGLNNGNWYEVCAIFDEVIFFATSTQRVPYNGLDNLKGHVETVDGSATVYKIEPHYIRASSISGTVETMYNNNYSDETSRLTISGGWNTTDMSSKSGITAISGYDGWGRYILTSQPSVTYQDLIVWGFYNQFYFQGSSAKNIKYIDMVMGGYANYGIYTATGNDSFEFTRLKFISGELPSIQLNGSVAHKFTNCEFLGSQLANYSQSNVYCYNVRRVSMEGLVSDHCCNYAFAAQNTTDIIMNDIRVNHHDTPGVYGSSDGFYFQGVSDLAINSGIVTAVNQGIRLYYSGGTNSVKDTKFDILSPDNNTILAGGTKGDRTALGLQNCEYPIGTIPEGRVELPQATIVTDTSVVAIGTGKSWKQRLISANQTTDEYPAEFTLAKVLVAAGVTVSVAASIRKSSNTNFDIKLFCPERQMLGLAETGITAPPSGPIDTWQRLSYDFVPTETGVIEIKTGLWGSTTSQLAYVDNLEVFQD